MYSLPLSALYKSVTARAFIVIPRSFSSSILSSSCADISLIETDSVSSKILSASVDFPWSICAIMLKFLILSWLILLLLVMNSNILLSLILFDYFIITCFFDFFTILGKKRENFLFSLYSTTVTGKYLTPHANASACEFIYTSILFP